MLAGVGPLVLRGSPEQNGEVPQTMVVDAGGEPVVLKR
jgi:hypothetical protein